MCGIYGTTLKYSTEVYRKKLTLMNFRGPDCQQFKAYDDRGVTLGHVRLAILDLDPRSNQPFDYNDRISIVFNGEIYNFKELYEDHLRGIALKTTSDTEIICAMYEKYGTDSFPYFNGMFSFVIFDRYRGKLVGCRDRLGKKPFYYWLSDKGIEFASQLSPISYSNNFHIDDFARQTYLIRSYIVDPFTIYKEVKKLCAGCYFEYDINSRKMQIAKYWDLFANSCRFETPKSYNEAKETIKEILYDAVKIRLRSDVPVGMFLSGGIDSSLTSAVVSKLNKDLHAYTIGFSDSKYDESQYSIDIAKALGIPIDITYCDGSDMINICTDMYNYFDEPFADPSLIPSSLVASKAQKNVTVVLGGDGGDELFYGYSSYHSYIKRNLMYNIIPESIRKLLYNNGCSAKLCSHAYLLQYSNADESILATHGYATFYGAEKFDRKEMAHKSPCKEYLENHTRGHLRYSDYDMKVYMNSCINTKTDRATMRSSLELRSPLMDYRLAEYSRLLPIEYLYDRSGKGKLILKDILYEMVPRNLLERPKHGFSAPVGKWLKNEMKECFLDTLTKDNIDNYIPEIDSSVILAKRDRFLKGEKISEMGFWNLYVYINWLINSR